MNNIYGPYGNYYQETVPRLISRNHMVPSSFGGSTFTINTASSADTQIHFSLCRVEGESTFHGLSLRAELNIAGGNRTVKYKLFEANRITGNPENPFYDDVFTIPSNANYSWQHFASSGTPLIQSEYFWLATQLPPSGFTSGQVWWMPCTSIGLTFSHRISDFYITSSSAFSYTTGIPDDPMSAPGLAVVETEVTGGSVAGFRNVLWGLLLKRLK